MSTTDAFFWLMQKIYFILLVFLPLVNFGQISKKWEGHYVGKLEIQSSDKTSHFHMELIFKKIDEFLCQNRAKKKIIKKNILKLNKELKSIDYAEKLIDFYNQN